jgi:acetyltransferase-like isoleucine patch superfamily enzyme
VVSPLPVKPRLGVGVVLGVDVHLGIGVVIWNYVVIGDNTRIGDWTRVGSFCDIGKGVEIGRGCNIQAHVTISNGSKIGDSVFIGPKATLLNDKYPVSSRVAPPVIRENVVIGGGAIIMPNVTVGEGAVVAAGSIVTRDVSPRTVVKGAPAKAFMSREEYDAKRLAGLSR